MIDSHSRLVVFQTEKNNSIYNSLLSKNKRGILLIIFCKYCYLYWFLIKNK